MALYKYIAISQNGKKIKGSLDADSSSALANQLRKESMTLISAEISNNKKQTSNKDEGKINTFFTFSKPIVNDDILIFFRQLAAMVDAGVPLVDCLSLLADQTEKPNFKKVLNNVKANVEAGEDLSQSFANYPKIFPQLTISMVKAAEISGNLASILEQLTTYIEDKDKIDKKIKSAVSYPKFILIFFGLVLSGVVFGLVPKFQEIFASFGAELPGPTLVLLSISNFAKDNILIEIAFLILLYVGFKIALRTDSGRYFFDGLKFKLPILGNINLKSTIAKFCKTLRALIVNGVVLVDSLVIASETSNNVVVQEAIEDVKIKVEGGTSLAKSLQAHDLFPVMMIKMIDVGEESGALEIMLEKISEFYERQFNFTIDSLTSIIEPILMIGLGILALIVVLSLYLPIFKMTGAISG
ncbi:MAG: type II secretion system F family protein [Candidatus Marinimicrobia bacterium]|nr:type II secretion system F family protein [Candidatus Neomarinimicrobiota bacterium]